MNIPAKAQVAAAAPAAEKVPSVGQERVSHHRHNQNTDPHPRGLPMLVGYSSAGLSESKKLGVWKASVFGHPSHVWFGAGTLYVETFQHLEGFPAKTVGSQQSLPSNLQVHEEKQCLALAKPTPI